MANELMFQIGIKEVKEKIDEIRKKYDDFEKKYGQAGITVKLNLQGATAEVDTLLKSLRMIGNADALKPLEQEFSQVKSQIDKTTDSINKENVEKKRQLKLLAEVRDMYQKLPNAMSAVYTGIDPKRIAEANMAFGTLLQKLGTIPPKTSLQELSAEFSALKSSFKGLFKDLEQAQKAEQSIRLVRFALKQLNEQLSTGKSSPKLEGIRDQLQAINREMHDMMKAGNYAGIQSLFAGHKGMSDGVVSIIRQMVSEMKKLGASTETTASVTSRLTAEEKQLAQALSRTSQEARSQSQIMSDLKSLATQYLGVWGAQNFIHNIIETGGQLEKQRLSMGAILADAQKANVLFGQIKDLAVKSPFGVVELDQYSKQLAAYGFKYYELYDMTKRLADISAGAGTEISRIALALGHVRAEGALSGYTLRQFAMNNIPMLQKLSERLSEIEGKLVSTAEIRERVSKKQIGYDDVIAVIKDLTDEGGMFYNMQEIISESVSAKFKNLRDSMDIMYGEMAESNIGDVLKSTATALTNLTRHWQVLMPVFGAGVAMFGVGRMKTFLYNKALDKTISSVIMSKAAFEGLTASQVKQMAVSGSLSREDLLLAVATKKLTVDQAELAAAHYGVSKAQLQQIRSTTALRGASSILGGVLSKIFSPQMLAFAGIELVVGAVTKYYEWVNKIDGKTKEMMDLTKSRILDLEDIQKTIGEGKPTDKLGLKTSVENMQNVLANSNLYTKTIDEQIKKAGTLSEKYDILAGSITTAIEKQKQMLDVQDTIGEAIKSSSWGFLGEDSEFNNLLNTPWFNNDITANIGDVNESYASLRKIIDGAWEYKDALKAVIDEMIDAGRFTEEFKSQLENAPFEEQIRILAESSYWGEIVNKIDGFEESAERIRKASSSVTDQWEEIATDDIPKMFAKIAEMRGIEEKEFRKWCVDNPDQLNIMLDALLDRLDVAEPKIRRKIKRMWYDFAQLGKLEKGLAEGASIGAVVGAAIANSLSFDELFPTEEQASVNPETTKSKVKGGKGSDDENAKVLREKVRILKEAADSYQYWRQKVGDASAETHMRDEFGQILDEQKLTINSSDELRAKLKELREEYSKKPQTKAMVEAIKEIDKELAQLDRKDFEKTAEDFSSKVQLELDSLSRAWETFNKVREATGNIDLAVQLSGIEYNGGKNQNIADALREKIQKDFASQGVAVDLNISLSDKQIEDEVKSLFFNAIPKREDFKEGEKGQEAYAKALEEHESKIKGLTEEYKKWRDLQRDVLQNDIDVFGKLLSSTVDLQSQVKKINDEYRKTIESLNRLKKEGKITDAQYGKAKSIADANTNMKLVQAKKEYHFLMDGVITMTKESAKTIKEEYVRALKYQLLAGAITAKEYADKIEEVNNKMRELENQKTDGMAYMQGGIDGLVNNMKKRGSSMNQQGAQLQQEAAKVLQENLFGGDSNAFKEAMSKMTSGQEMSAAGQGLSEFASGMGETIGYVDAIVHGINNVVQGLKAMVDEIDDMNEALGYDTKTGDFGHTFMNSFSSASQQATNAFDSFKNGDAGGMLAGIVGSWTEWVEGFAKGHDEALAYQIELAERQLKVLNNIDSRLSTEIDRTLGGGLYATSDSRTSLLFEDLAKAIKSFGEGNIKEYAKTDPSIKGMLSDLTSATREAVVLAAENNSVYSAQYATMMAQRDKIQSQLDNERDKKDADSNAIEEYRNQIAELDDQIKYFVEDTAKELYGLDLKGWASQIGDALMTAFENGEDAMKAFRDTAKDIIKDVASEMLKLGIIEPMMENMRKELFETEWTDSNGNVYKGAYNQTTGRFDEERTLEILGRYLGEGGELEKSVEAGEQFYEWVKKITGVDLSSDDTKSSTGSSIKGITEDTAGLLASYVNSCRADLSVLRQSQAAYFEDFRNAMTRGNASLQNIENHTAAIMRSNDIIAEKITNLDSNINGLKNKAWKIPTV